MDALARWIVKWERPVAKVGITLLGVYAAMGCLGMAIAAIITASEGGSAQDVGLLQIGTLLLSLLTIPFIAQVRRGRRRVPLQPLIMANAQGKLAEKLGENAPLLEGAALDLEQMQSLLSWTTLDRALQRELSTSPDARMLRMLELVVAAPARYGFTLAQAERQVQEDARWLTEVRRLVERVREAPERQDEDGSLDHLRALVAAREEATAELRA